MVSLRFVVYDAFQAERRVVKLAVLSSTLACGNFYRLTGFSDNSLSVDLLLPKDLFLRNSPSFRCDILLTVMLTYCFRCLSSYLTSCQSINFGDLATQPF